MGRRGAHQLAHVVDGRLAAAGGRGARTRSWLRRILRRVRLHRDQLGRRVDARLLVDRDRARRRRGSRRGCRRPGRGRPRSRAARSAGRPRAARGSSSASSVSSSGANTPRVASEAAAAASSGRSDVGDREVVARHHDAPAEVALLVARERDRVLHGRVGAAMRLTEPASLPLRSCSLDRLGDHARGPEQVDVRAARGPASASPHRRRDRVRACTGSAASPERAAHDAAGIAHSAAVGRVEHDVGRRPAARGRDEAVDRGGALERRRRPARPRS